MIVADDRKRAAQRRAALEGTDEAKDRALHESRRTKPPRDPAHEPRQGDLFEGEMYGETERRLVRRGGQASWESCYQSRRVQFETQDETGVPMGQRTQTIRGWRRWAKKSRLVKMGRW